MIAHPPKRTLPTYLLLPALLTGTLLVPTALTAQEQASGGDFLSADKQGSASASKMFGSDAATQSGKKLADGWHGKANTGLVISTGNAENNSINAGVKANYLKQDWRHTLAANIYFAESEGEQTAERYAVSYKLGYKINNKSYAFNFLSYDSDEFANIDSRLANVVGYGHYLIETKNHTLDAELGVGFRQTQFTNNRSDSEEAVGHFGLNYEGKLTETTRLTSRLLIQGGSDNVYTQSATTLNVAMTERLSLGLSYTINNNSDTPDGIEKTDTVTSINLVAGF